MYILLWLEQQQNLIHYRDSHFASRVIGGNYATLRSSKLGQEAIHPHTGTELDCGCCVALGYLRPRPPPPPPPPPQPPPPLRPMLSEARALADRDCQPPPPLLMADDPPLFSCPPQPLELDLL